MEALTSLGILYSEQQVNVFIGNDLEYHLYLYQAFLQWQNLPWHLTSQIVSKIISKAIRSTSHFSVGTHRGRRALTSIERWTNLSCTSLKVGLWVQLHLLGHGRLSCCSLRDRSSQPFLICYHLFVQNFAVVIPVFILSWIWYCRCCPVNSGALCFTM